MRGGKKKEGRKKEQGTGGGRKEGKLGRIE